MEFSYEGFPSVSIDHEAAEKLACELAFQRGGQSVCTVWDSRFHVATNLRRTAFTKRAEELGLELSESQFICEGSSEDGYELGRSLIQKGQLKKVLYCNNESVSRGLLTVMNEAGIRVGEELFLFTANNGPDAFCRYMTPSVTTISPRYVYRASMPELME